MGGKGSGCGGGLILAVVLALALIAGAAWLTGKLAEYNDAEASRLYARGSLEESYGRAQAEITRANAEARAAVIVAESQARLDTAVGEAQMMLAQGQARLDSAQAFAVTAGASLPWLVVTLVGIAGVVLLAAIVAIFALALAAISQRQPPSFLPGPRRVQVIDQDSVYLDLPALQEADYEHRRLR
jgi:hypothetical protein